MAELTMCDVVNPVLDAFGGYFREKVVDWAVREPDRAWATVGVVAGGIAMGLVELLIRQAVGCPRATLVAPRAQALTAPAPRPPLLPYPAE